MIVSAIPHLRSDFLQFQEASSFAFQSLAARIKEYVVPLFWACLGGYFIASLWMCMGHTVAASVSAGLATTLSAVIACMAIRIAMYMKPRKLNNAPAFEAKSLEIKERLQSEKETVRRVFQNLMATRWGKRWLKVKNISMDEAFELEYKELFGGTCAGQTLSMLKIMPTHHSKSGKDLLKGLHFDQIVQYQMNHGLRVDLGRWKMGLDASSSKIPKNRKKLQIAWDEAFEQEGKFNFVHVKPFIKLKKVSNEQEFYVALRTHLEKIDTGFFAPIAGQIHLKAHTVFIQCNPGYTRFYDINGGFFNFPDREALIKGLYRHLQRYSAEKRETVTFFPYEINP